MTDRNLSLVLPVFNEEETLPRLLDRLRALQQELPRLTEIIFVDDGSTDRSFALLRMAVDSATGWRLLRFSRNFGQQVASLAGLQHAGGDAVVLMDADLQDPPEVIAAMLQRWDDGWDVVYGVRRLRSGDSLLKRVAAKLFYRLLSRVSEVPIPVDAGDFRLMDRRVVDVLNRLGEQRPYVRGLVAWAGFRQTSIVFDRQPRREGTSSYDIGRMLRLSIDAIVGFSSAPLRVVTRLGILVVLLTLAYSIVVFGLWFAGINVPGWTSMMLVILFLGAVQLISLGVIGEYLANLVLEAKGRPRYVIAFDSAAQGGDATHREVEGK
ncbi:MAG: glycosyltransferase family 2 protein [Chromatocurvus sp.]